MRARASHAAKVVKLVPSHSPRLRSVPFDDRTYAPPSAAEPASPAGPVWEIESLDPGEFDYNLDEGRVILNDRFRITFEEQGERAFIIADRGRLDQATGEIFAEGSVTLQNRDRVFTSERLFYNFQTRAMQTDNFRAGQPPASLIKLSAITRDRQQTRKAWLNFQTNGQTQIVSEGEQLTIDGTQLEIRQIRQRDIQVAIDGSTPHRVAIGESLQ